MSEGTPLVADGIYSRPALNTQDPNSIRIIYHAELDGAMKFCLCLQGIVNPCSGLFCQYREAFDQSYVRIYENRVEVNMPSMFQCCLCLSPCSEVNDYVQVYHFDKRIAQEAHHARLCNPISCPIGINPFCGGYIPPAVTFIFPCCPTCFDMCGQGVILHGKLPIVCCHQFAQIPFLRDADDFVDAFNRARATFGSGPSADITPSTTTPEACYGSVTPTGPSTSNAPTQETMG